MDTTLDLERINKLIARVDRLEAKQVATEEQRTRLSNSIDTTKRKLDAVTADLEEVVQAVQLLQIVSDSAVHKSYAFIEDSVNSALERIFVNSERKIQLKETAFRGQYPQLEIQLFVEGGRTRSLKLDSGHGLMQIISLLCVLCLIVITGSRKLLVLDEVLSGLSAKSRIIVCEIMETFTQIGFQFVINEHGLIPKGSYVIHLEAHNGISNVKEEYIEENGVYLDGAILTEQNRKAEKTREIEESQTEAVAEE